MFIGSSITTNQTKVLAEFYIFIENFEKSQ